MRNIIYYLMWPINTLMRKWKIKTSRERKTNNSTLQYIKILIKCALYDISGHYIMFIS